MKTAIVSVQASPLGTAYAMDSDGQNIHIAELSAALARRGHDVTVYTRREHPSRPERVVTDGGYTVVHIDAGPAEPLSEPELFEYLGAFGAELAAQWSDRTPDVAHAHYWTSGIATELAAREAHIPTVQTFHELGAVKQRQLGAGQAGPTARVKLERLVARNASWVAAASTDELMELMRMGCSRSRMSVVPCGVDVNAFATEGPCVERGDRPRILAAGVPVSHKGFDTMIIALRGIPDAELVIVGGPEIERLGSHPEVHRLSVLASELGVADRVVFHRSGTSRRHAGNVAFRRPGAVHPVVRGLRIGSARGDGLRCSGRRHGGGRNAGHDRPRRDGPLGAAAQPTRHR